MAASHLGPQTSQPCKGYSTALNSLEEGKADEIRKHADRAELHRSGKLVTATRARALGLRTHVLNRSSCDSKTTLPRGAKSASTAPGKLLSRSTANACYFILQRLIPFRN